MVVNTNILSSS